MALRPLAHSAGSPGTENESRADIRTDTRAEVTARPE